jgi:putative component of toxin-antitoxin plasmid stabilization module
MPNFALADMPEIRGKIKFRKLIVDGVCPYDEFCSEVRHDGNLEKQLAGLLNNMNQVAGMNRLPHEKFKDITPKGELIKEFEVKKGDLRVYMIKEEGHVVIIAGKKNTQQKDIRRFQSLKKQYLDSKQ